MGLRLAIHSQSFTSCPVSACNRDTGQSDNKSFRDSVSGGEQRSILAPRFVYGPRRIRCR